MSPRRRTLLIYAAVILFAWILVGVGSAVDNRRLVTELKPVLVNAENNHFLAKADIEEVVRKVQGRPIVEVPRGEVKIAAIERSLEENPYVKEAEAYREMTGAVVVRMELRKPLARVLFDDGDGFYIDQEFNKVALSPRFSANTPLVRGLTRRYLTASDSASQVFLLEFQGFLRFIHESEFLRSQISEIVVDDLRELTLYPEVGSAAIEFGRPVRIAEKFGDLEFFYRRVLNYVGWESYQTICLKYKDQIVAKR
jgi:cell division protein FtsQ